MDTAKMKDSARGAAERVAHAGRRLHELGMLDPRRGYAAVRATPWLIGRGPTLGLAEQIHARAHAREYAIIDSRGALTWRALDRRVNRLAGALVDAGVTSGDAVATLLRNGREIGEVILATQKSSLVAMPLNTWGSRDELSALLDRSRPAALVYDTRHADQLEGVVPGDTTLFAVGDADEALDGSTMYEDALRGGPMTPPRPFGGDRGKASVVIHTSGTTGIPKAAERDLSASGLLGLLGLVERVPYRRDDVIVCPAPLFHSFGLLTFATAIVSGATIVLPDRFDPEETLDAIATYSATALSLVPVMVRRIIELPEETTSRYDMSRLRILLTSGSAMGPDLRRAATDVFGEVLYDLYGSTEAGWVAIATPEDIRERVTSVGRPVAGVDVAIVNDDGEQQPRGETGRVLVKSALRFEGYASGEDVPEERGYLDTGDLGRIDEDGFLLIAGRADDMAVIGGENVYPVEVENVVSKIDGVDEVVVFPVSDEEYGEIFAAFVVGNTDASTVRAACEESLASFKVPRHIEIVDQLPRTATGKVLRRELREQIS